MDYTIMEDYHRKGKKVWITVKITGFGVLFNRDGESYEKSFAWAEMKCDEGKFSVNNESVRVHEEYPVPERIDSLIIEKIFNESKIAKKILGKMVDHTAAS